MIDFEMSNSQGCWLAVIGAVTQHLEVGSFVTQLDMTQSARFGPLYTFKGWTNQGAQISGEVLWYDHSDNLSVKVMKAKLKLVWRNDWRDEGKLHHGQFECEYRFPEKVFAGGYGVTRM